MAANQKTCLEQCFVEHRKNRRKVLAKIKTKENQKKNWKCKFCNNLFSRDRYRNGFCTRSCASQFYIQNGTYDKWIKTGVDLNKRKLKYRTEHTCTICKKKYTVRPKENKRTKTCSRTCKMKYMLLNNDINLKRTSKGQQHLFEILEQAFPDANVGIEKPIRDDSKIFFVDILLPKHNLVVEYYGDYWHCNPNIYSANYYNSRLSLYASDVWNRDKQRKKSIENRGYDVIVVWEQDFEHNKNKVVQKLIENINIHYIPKENNG